MNKIRYHIFCCVSLMLLVVTGIQNVAASQHFFTGPITEVTCISEQDQDKDAGEDDQVIVTEPVFSLSLSMNFILLPQQTNLPAKPGQAVWQPPKTV